MCPRSCSSGGTLSTTGTGTTLSLCPWGRAAPSPASTTAASTGEASPSDRAPPRTRESGYYVEIASLCLNAVMLQTRDSFWRGRVRGLRRENPVHLLRVQRLKTNIQIQWMSKYWEIRSRKSWLLKYLKIKMRFLVTLSVFLYDAKLWVFIKWLSYCLEIFCKQ